LTLGGFADVVASDVDLIDKEAAAMGLKLNKSKCELLSNVSTVNKSFAGFKITPLNEMRLLGGAVMQGQEVAKVLQEKTEDLRRALSRLALLQAQDALTLLRYSLSILLIVNRIQQLKSLTVC
jgi:hypothetical protein